MEISSLTGRTFRSLRYEDCVFWLSEDMLKGKDVIGNQLTFTVYGTLSNQQMGVATIGMDDLNNLVAYNFVAFSRDAGIKESDCVNSVSLRLNFQLCLESGRLLKYLEYISKTRRQLHTA
jgi:hypothetical protein